MPGEEGRKSPVPHEFPSIIGIHFMASPSTTTVAAARREFAVEIVRQLRAAGYIAYWAGGCVRDLLLGKEAKDYDVATDSRPESVRQVFGPRKTKAVGAAFGVILVHGPGFAGDVEVATFRAEGPYLDGRRPSQVVFCTPEQDALRRDFTINGMFFDPLSNEVHDYVGGQADLTARIVRAIGDPRARFEEDKLRLLRAIRFAAVLDFQLEAETRQAVVEMASTIHIVSVERITQEWRRMLLDPGRVRALSLAAETGLLRENFREIPPDWLRDSPDWPLTLAAMSAWKQVSFSGALALLFWRVPGITSETLRSLCRRLRFSNEEQDLLLWLFEYRTAIHGIKQFPTWKWKRLLAQPHTPELLTLLRAAGSVSGSPLDDLDYAERLLQTTPREVLDPPVLLTGDDLILAGYAPGPQFRDWLELVRNAQLDGTLTSRDEALEFVRGLVGSLPAEEFNQGEHRVHRVNRVKTKQMDAPDVTD